MSAAMLLFIGRAMTKADSYFSALQKNYDVRVATSATQAHKLLQQDAHHFAVIVLDAISLRTPGERMSRELKDAYPKIPLIHLYPGKGGDSVAEIVMPPPVSSRKLVSNVKRLLDRKADKLLQCGPFVMNLNRRIIAAFGQETELTPKQAELLEFFLRHPNETLDRKILMKTIWQTDYLEDTRTLDVHIRWLRQALEGDGKHPRRLKTVRGVGYQLEIPEVIRK